MTRIIIIIANVVSMYICYKWLKKGGAEEATVALISQGISLLLLFSESKFSRTILKRVKNDSKVVLEEENQNISFTSVKDTDNANIKITKK